VIVHWISSAETAAWITDGNSQPGLPASGMALLRPRRHSCFDSEPLWKIPALRV